MNSIQIMQISHKEFCDLITSIIRTELQNINQLHKTQKEEFLNSAQVASMLGISKQTLKRRVNDSVIPVHRVGSLLKYKKSEIEKFMADIPALKIAS